MTASFLRGWKSAARRALLGLVAGIALVVPAVAGAADGVALKSVQIDATDEGFRVNADFDVQLPPAMLEAVRKGVPLVFVVEFELKRGRWYWLDETVAKVSRDRRVTFAPLTEQYRVTSSGFTQTATTPEELQRILSRVRAWTVIERNRLQPGEKYFAAIRFRLDTSQLPKPFQLNFIGSREWELTTDWHRWTFVPGAEK